MIVSILVAVSENGVIGKDNQLLWRLSEDLKLFKKRTTGSVIIMGRKTFDSIGKALPNRTNLVISRDENLKIEGCEVVNTIEAALEIAKKQNHPEIFIIGGEMIYDLAIPHCNKIYLTLVQKTYEGDAFFDFKPFLNWQLISKTSFVKDNKNECDFEILELTKNPV